MSTYRKLKCLCIAYTNSYVTQLRAHAYRNDKCLRTAITGSCVPQWQVSTYRNYTFLQSVSQLHFSKFRSYTSVLRIVATRFCILQFQASTYRNYTVLCNTSTSFSHTAITGFSIPHMRAFYILQLHVSAYHKYKFFYVLR